MQNMFCKKFARCRTILPSYTFFPPADILQTIGEEKRTEEKLREKEEEEEEERKSYKLYVANKKRLFTVVTT
jgi:hypothetical protein